MKAWDDTVAAALLGTARRPPPRGEGDGRLGTVLAEVGERSAEAALLGSAGALAVFRRAGERAGTPGADPGPAAEADPRPLPSLTAAGHLDVMLDGAHAAALDEWLAVAAERGLRAPPAALPELLWRAADDDDLRAPVGALAGPRGRWLAARNPDWSWLGATAGGATDEEIEDLWRTGDADERLDLLFALRSFDPGPARELLESTWDDETPEARAALLGALETNLGPDDEPLLERALGDRRKPVRTTAADLLASLPTSAFASRVAAVAGPLVTRTGGLRPKLEVEPPADLDPALGLERRPPKKRGERSWWLEQLVAATPLHTWTDRLGGTPEDVVGLRAPREWRDELHAGWIAAAVRQRDTEWARALLALRRLPELIDVLPREEAERTLADEVRRRGGVELPLDGPPWGADLSDAVARRTVQLHAEGRPLERYAAKLAAGSLEVAERALEPLAESGDWRSTGPMRALTLVRFRRAMLAALTEEPAR